MAASTGTGNCSQGTSAARRKHTLMPNSPRPPTTPKTSSLQVQPGNRKGTSKQINVHRKDMQFLFGSHPPLITKESKSELALCVEERRIRLKKRNSLCFSVKCVLHIPTPVLTKFLQGAGGC